ncbi:heavy-metal-associated domain-containing protein [Halomonas sp. JS92-SW72]|uniref:heavy-metal-associated domain-containing protein n=1 Tax=Halomonas sp. JS92-SW72 TaxID=2306583 RepID=UPI000E5C2B71|nr:heavy-metal-associated domain-containing protein [Halomonas sp. JS92-SW72]AXY43012.1 copper chaperone [Halomonas sp. JS92-SW72]
MGSDHCAGIVRKTLERLNGVSEIQTNIANHHVSVTVGEDGPDADALKGAVEGAGYDVAAVQAEGDDTGDDAEIEAAYLAQARQRRFTRTNPQGEST